MKELVIRAFRLQLAFIAYLFYDKILLNCKLEALLLILFLSNIVMITARRFDVSFIFHFIMKFLSQPRYLLHGRWKAKELRSE